jgi:hypothetical protein
MNLCNHLFVDGFGGMGDALVCVHCGLDMYPEAIPVQVALATAQGRIIRNTHPKYKAFADAARAARTHREAKEKIA